MHRIWTVALTIILVSAPSITGLLLSSCDNESARVRVCKDTQRNGAALLPAKCSVKSIVERIQPAGGTPATRADDLSADLRRRESAGRSDVADMPVSIAQLGRGTASLIHSSTVGERPGRPADDLLWAAICMVESGGDRYAYNEREEAVGIAQIRDIYRRDANRILGRMQFDSKDRWSVVKSREMFHVIIGCYGRSGTDEEAARIHNGGPRGMQKQATVKYWVKVRQAMAQLEGE